MASGRVMSLSRFCIGLVLLASLLIAPAAAGAVTAPLSPALPGTRSLLPSGPCGNRPAGRAASDGPSMRHRP